MRSEMTKHLNKLTALVSDLDNVSGNNRVKVLQRNYDGMVKRLQAVGSLTISDINFFLQACNFGQKKHPFWGALNDLKTSDGIKNPKAFLMSRIKRDTAIQLN